MVPHGIEPGTSACKADVITATLRNHIELKKYIYIHMYIDDTNADIIINGQVINKIRYVDTFILANSDNCNGQS